MSQSSTWNGCLTQTALGLVTLLSPAYAIDRELSAAAPQGPMVVVIVDPTGREPQNPSTVEMAAGTLERLREMGLLSMPSVETSLLLDTVLAWPILAAQPFAIMLTDVEAQRYGRGHRLSGLRLGLILHTKGANGRITAAIQRFLNRYTNSTLSRVESAPPPLPPRFRLIDSRLPPWAIVEWGAVGDYYLICLGRPTFDQLSATLQGKRSCLGDDPAFAEAFEALQAERASALWYIDFKRLRLALAGVMGELPQQVLDALQLGDLDSSVWAFTREDRTIRLERYGRSGDHGKLARIASPASEAELVRGVVPPQAEWYALIRWPPRSLALSVRDAYLRMRSPPKQVELRQSWSDLEQDLNISIERDLLDQLGDSLLLHTDPPHPLGIGLLCTVQIEITGSATSVRTTIDKLLRHWQRHRTQQQNADHRHDRWSFLRHADDGVWYLQFGLYGPALVVHDKWIVISFSPQAVRQNVKRLTASKTPPRNELRAETKP